jgi:hypothetical protein
MDPENFYYDELERDWDEREAYDYPNPDADYENLYDLRDL